MLLLLLLLLLLRRLRLLPARALPSPEALPANAQVAVGLGTLAGSTVMLLTLAWGGSVLAGRCDLDDQVCCSIHMSHGHG